MIDVDQHFKTLELDKVDRLSTRKNLKREDFKKILDMDLGEMFLIYNEILVLRSSLDCIFFRIDEGCDDDTGELVR